MDPNEVFSDSNGRGREGACSRKSSAFSHASVVDVVDLEDNITLTSRTRMIRSFKFSTTAFIRVNSASHVEVMGRQIFLQPLDNIVRLADH